MGRFINGDDRLVDNGNMFAYCGNNPVMNIDRDGHWSWSGIKNAVQNAFNTIVRTVAKVATTILNNIGIDTSLTASGAIGEWDASDNTSWFNPIEPYFHVSENIDVNLYKPPSLEKLNICLNFDRDGWGGIDYKQSINESIYLNYSFSSVGYGINESQNKSIEFYANDDGKSTILAKKTIINLDDNNSFAVSNGIRIKEDVLRNEILIVGSAFVGITAGAYLLGPIILGFIGTVGGSSIVTPSKI